MVIKLKEEELKSYFAQEDDVEFVLVFGSVVSGKDSPLSDIDIAVYFQNEKDILAMGERQIEITCAVMRICKLNRVDIVVLNLANPFLRFQVVKYGRLFYAKNEKAFYRFKAASFGLYQATKPLYELYDKVTKESLRRGFDG